MIVEFYDSESASIKSFAVKKKSEIKVTTRIMSRKLLMFAKFSLKSLIYTLPETLYFPNEIVKEIYEINNLSNKQNTLLPYFNRYRQHLAIIYCNL